MVDEAFDATGYRRVVKLDGAGLCRAPGPAPRIVELRLDQLVINEEYQRDLSKRSLDQIRRMAEDFDWRAYKALSVAKTDCPEIYEIVDGQHTALAAATNGHIRTLPCLLQESATLKDKAQSFIGINSTRIALTPGAIFNAKVAAQDDIAIKAFCAMDEAGARLLTVFPYNKKFKIGDVLAVATLQAIVKKNGQARLAKLLKVAVMGKAAPISAVCLLALDLALPPGNDPEIENRVALCLERHGAARLEAEARRDTKVGHRVYETIADMIADLAKLPQRRMGLPPPKRATKWMRKIPIDMDQREFQKRYIENHTSEDRK